MNENGFLEQIKAHVLGDIGEARSIYFAYCAFLKDKYGLVDRSYDQYPTRRGKEWLDIHHIMEYELDDIANRTKAAIWDAKYNGDSAMLEELRPYNVQEQLVYANKIEHFLLHYLIDSMRGQKVFSGGPNYVWDQSIALAVYGFEKEYLNDLKKHAEQFYSFMSCEVITRLYKKLIDWKEWDIEKCSIFWGNYKYAVSALEKNVMTIHNDVDKKSGGKIKLKDLIGLDPVKKIQLQCKNCEEVQTITMQEYESLSELHCSKCE